MALLKRSFKNYVAEEMGEFPHFLLWAVLEWILILSLYIDGFIAFISSSFAKIFELEPPCVLCTRVDHALACKDPNTYYNESICECHKKDISFLAFCHVHRKLANIQHTCEGCIFSFATEKGLNKTIFLNSVEDHNDSNENVLDVKRCSCCGEPSKIRAYSKDYSRRFTNASASMINTSCSPRATTCFKPTWKTEVSDHSEIHTSEYDFGFETYAKSYEECEEACKTIPNLLKSNSFFRVPLTDSDSPRFIIRATKKVSLEKSNLLSETNDETSVGDDNSSLGQLKKQAHLDHQKALQSLSMELEEERSAAAVAANNAMAMITRLQEEKASFQMEALQYQRIMEEQIEYDQEAIRILEDLLAKRDEHVMVMESELESYREKYGGIGRNVGGIDECEADDADEFYQEWRTYSFLSFDERSEPETPFENVYEGPSSPFENSPTITPPKDFNESRNHGKGGTYEEPLLDFENEKHQLYIMLKDLENHIKSSSLQNENEDKCKLVQDNKATLNRELSLIKERLRTLEADSGFLKHTVMTLEKGEKGTELLREIAQHLRNLCHSENIYTSKSKLYDNCQL